MHNKITEYKEKLFDPHWSKKRNSILSRDGFKCVVCKYRGNLHVHHRQYHYSKTNSAFVDPWEYEDHLLITLCKWCHKKGHKLYHIPKLNIN